MALQIASAGGFEQILGHVLLDVDDGDRRGAFAETTADGGEKLGAMMSGGMDDEECDRAVIGGQFGLCYERGVIRPAIACKAALAGAIDGLEA